MKAVRGLKPEQVTAMVMAAGFGRRMAPLSNDTPKPLLLFDGRALIDHGLERLAAAGIERCVVNVHYLADQIENHLHARRKPAIWLSDEREQLLDTGGGAARALDRLGPGPFVVLNSDSLWCETREVPALDRLLGGWRDDAMDGLMVLARRDNALGYDGKGDFELSPHGVLERVATGGTAPYVNMGLYLMHPRLFHDLPPGPFSMNLLWDRAIAAGRLHGIVHDGLWLHLGTPEALALAERRIAAGRNPGRA
jgi:MurNAc alpha-1-phosphate uridylyltransferase